MLKITKKKVVVGITLGSFVGTVVITYKFMRNATLKWEAMKYAKHNLDEDNAMADDIWPNRLTHHTDGTPRKHSFKSQDQADAFDAHSARLQKEDEAIARSVINDIPRWMDAQHKMDAERIAAGESVADVLYNKPIKAE